MDTKKTCRLLSSIFGGSFMAKFVNEDTFQFVNCDLLLIYTPSLKRWNDHTVDEYGVDVTALLNAALQNAERKGT